MAERGTNGAGHAEDLMILVPQYNRHFVAFERPVAMEEQFSKRQPRGNEEEGKPETLGVGLVIKEYITTMLGPGGIVPEYVRAKMVEVRVVFGHEVATTFIVRYAPTETATTSEKTKS